MPHIVAIGSLALIALVFASIAWSRAGSAKYTYDQNRADLKRVLNTLGYRYHFLLGEPDFNGANGLVSKVAAQQEIIDRLASEHDAMVAALDIKFGSVPAQEGRMIAKLPPQKRAVMVPCKKKP